MELSWAGKPLPEASPSKQEAAPIKWPPLEVSEVYKAQPRTVVKVKAWRDEFLHGAGGIPVDTVSRWFERGRTLSLGPVQDGLGRMARENLGLAVVGLTDVRLNTESVRPGDELEVWVHADLSKPRRPNMFQSVWLDGRCIAHGKTELVTLDISAQKLAKLPEWAKDYVRDAGQQTFERCGLP
ncbi:unnamed protein product [Chrysoparadoxa australica]